MQLIQAKNALGLVQFLHHRLSHQFLFHKHLQLQILSYPRLLLLSFLLHHQLSLHLDLQFHLHRECRPQFLLLDCQCPFLELDQQCQFLRCHLCHLGHQLPEHHKSHNLDLHRQGFIFSLFDFSFLYLFDYMSFFHIFFRFFSKFLSVYFLFCFCSFPSIPFPSAAPISMTPIPQPVTVPTLPQAVNIPPIRVCCFLEFLLQ